MHFRVGRESRVRQLLIHEQQGRRKFRDKPMPKAPVQSPMRPTCGTRLASTNARKHRAKGVLEVTKFGRAADLK
jgi:hypothetical protein